MSAKGSRSSYLGDGVYIELREFPGQLVLYTHNGIEATNKIYLEEEIVMRLRDFLIGFTTPSAEAPASRDGNPF
jgi:hypothetical protein